MQQTVLLNGIKSKVVILLVSVNIKSFENIKILMETILLDIIGIMLMRTWIMGTREITAPHSGGEYYSDNLIFISFFVRC